MTALQLDFHDDFASSKKGGSMPVCIIVGMLPLSVLPLPRSYVGLYLRPRREGCELIRTCRSAGQ